MTTATITRYEGPVLSHVERSPLGDQREQPVRCARCATFTTSNISGVCNLCTPCVNARLDDDDPDKCSGSAYVWFEGRTPYCPICALNQPLYRSPWVIAQGPDGWQLQTRDGLGIPHGPVDTIEAVRLRRSFEARLVVRSLRLLGASSHPFVFDDGTAAITCCVDGAADHGCCTHELSAVTS